jgi:formate dehydrogenase beta subunit
VTISRREVLKSLGCGTAVVAAGAAGLGSAQASEALTAPADALGLLYDATTCIGCKACVSACTTANGLIPDTERSGGIWQMPSDLNAQTKNIIRLYSSADGTENSFIKRQCMHCIDPACVSGCPFGALVKGKNGIVDWKANRCIGCRYCEISCPFDVPRFEWAKFNPKIVKCELCHERLADGKQPACTDVCPTGAVIFGTREQLLAEAKKRIAKNPGKYFENRVYGEYDLGGTQVLYLSHVAFDKLGLPVGTESRAEYGSKVHRVLYKGMVIPAVVYAGLVAILRKRWNEHQEEAHQSEKSTGLPHQL